MIIYLANVFTWVVITIIWVLITIREPDNLFNYAMAIVCFLCCLSKAKNFKSKKPRVYE